MGKWKPIDVRDRTMADKLMYIPIMNYKIIHWITIIGWNVWTLNLIDQPIKNQ